MTIRLPFIDRITVIYRDLINGKDFDLNTSRSYEVEILPWSMQRRSQQNPLSSLHAIKLGATVAAPLLSVRAERIWLVNRGSGLDVVKHTHSNLG